MTETNLITIQIGRCKKKSAVSVKQISSTTMCCTVACDLLFVIHAYLHDIMKSIAITCRLYQIYTELTHSFKEAS